MKNSALFAISILSILVGLVAAFFGDMTAAVWMIPQGILGLIVWGYEFFREDECD